MTWKTPPAQVLGIIGDGFIEKLADNATRHQVGERVYPTSGSM
jgi:hypothetical protein